MRRKVSRLMAAFLTCLLAGSLMLPVAYAADTTGSAVEKVTAQLQQIDTLQQMQDKRSNYPASGKYLSTTTDAAMINAHESQRALYEPYIAKMFAARAAAQQAYDALTDAEKAQIDPALVAKLNNNLPTEFNPVTCAVTPSDDEYIYETAIGPTGNKVTAYEESPHATAGWETPMTFILVDTSNGETTWTPNGKYVYGESNYDVTYCCDLETGVDYNIDYKRTNLEDSNYYSPAAAKYIRGIVQNAYPFVSIEEMKANLIAGGLKRSFVDQLTRADLIAGVQMAIWAYSNSDSAAIAQNVLYGGTIDVKSYAQKYVVPLHDYTNELWTWWTTTIKAASYDARTEYRVNTLVHYLCTNTKPVEANESQMVISDMKVARAQQLASDSDTYSVGMHVYLNTGSRNGDDLRITATSYHENPDGTRSVTGTNWKQVTDKTHYEMSVAAKYGDTIEVMVEGTQNLEKGVYFYEARGGRKVSQSLVGVAGGITPIRAIETFEFQPDIEMGLRIYKTSTKDNMPLSDIKFHVYDVPASVNEVLTPIPTKEEVAKFAKAENLVGTIVTDATGYGAMTLEKGVYLVVEEHNAEKIKTPVDPFYIHVPMPVQKESAGEGTDTVIEIEYLDVVSVYPKNEPIEPPPPPPPPPPPENVMGRFEILKYDANDENVVLEGAEFKVYRPATEEDTETKIITVDGVEYAVVPAVDEDGAEVILTTGADGKALSPRLTCGLYFLVETKAPKGYNLLKEPVLVSVISEELVDSVTISVPNQKGNILPETGGMGTTIFMTLGSIMCLTAVVLLVTKKRMVDYE